MDQPEHIGARLRRLRAAMGFPQAKQFAEFLGINEQAYNHFERGRRAPTWPDALKIAGKTGASLDWLFRGQESQNPGHLIKKLAAIPEPEMKPIVPVRRASNG